LKDGCGCILVLLFLLVLIVVVMVVVVVIMVARAVVILVVYVLFYLTDIVGHCRTHLDGPPKNNRQCSKKSASLQHKHGSH
jgi:fatty acid desaturase